MAVDPDKGSFRLRSYLLQAGIIVIAACLVFTVLRFFSLAPQVGGNFFFSSDNPRFQDNRFMLKMFPGQASLIVVSVSGDISSGYYMRLISKMSTELGSIDGVSRVKSLSNGPEDLVSARESPLWSRILLSEKKNSSNILLFLDVSDPRPVVDKIEYMTGKYKDNGREIRIAGLPYVVEMIRRNLVFDLRVFSSIACVVFGIAIILMFRSVTILAGTFSSAVSAASVTIILGDILGAEIGILTANIITIIFVLTLSHIIYLTHNWKNARNEFPGEKAPDEAIKRTFSASAWCMATTFLGFGSLLFVEAKPLRELGLYGLIGTFSAITVTYIFYPAFLRTAKPRSRIKDRNPYIHRVRGVMIRSTPIVAIALILSGILVSSGMMKLNTDPSLFAFFRKGSDLREGLEYIDENGGSTPLNIILRDSYGDELTGPENYRRLWELQERIESERSVGSVLSLPLILAEGKRNPLGALLPEEGLAELLALPVFGSIARSFITPDHISTHFFIRMREAGRRKKRKAVAADLEQIVIRHGFIPEIISGLYLLQGELSALVSDSIVKGVGRLLIFFFVISILMSWSLRMSIAMIVSVSIIPVMIYGVVGLLRVPVDLISAPAANIAIAMGIDSMIHFISYARRRAREKPSGDRTLWENTQEAMYGPVMKETSIICMGFLIFLISSFPPTRRFGLEIVFGTAISALATLFILPFLASFLLPDTRGKGQH